MCPKYPNYELLHYQKEGLGGGGLIGLLGFHNEPGSGLEPPYLVYKTKALPLS